MIIVLANKSITTCSFTSLLVYDFKSKQLLKATFKMYSKRISLEIYYTHHDTSDFTFHHKVNSRFSPANFGY